MRLFILSCCLSVLFFISCSQSEKIDRTTPKFNFPNDAVFTAYKDTLRLKGTFRNGFQIDSIAAGDTAYFRIDIDGVFHDLTEIDIALSLGDSIAELLFLDKAYMDSLFLSSSNYEEGKFYLAEGKKRIPFYFQYAAKKADKNIQVDITAYSNADADNNTNHFQLKVPVKQTPPPKLYISSDTIYTANDDTLKIRTVSSALRLDPITIGDMAYFYILLDGDHNNLKRFTLTPTNRTDAEIVLPDEDELDRYFLATSDYAAGKFDMDSSRLLQPFSFGLRALSGNDDFKLTFEIESDALHAYGISKFELYTPIKVVEEEKSEPSEQ